MESRESLRKLVDWLVPCEVAYWSQEAKLLDQAASLGLCKMEIIGYPRWKFMKLAMVLAALLLSCGAAEAKDVVIPYDDFIKILASKEHDGKTIKKLSGENGLLVKLKDEQGSIITVQKEQIQACQEIVQSHEKIGATDAQMYEAVQAQLSGKTRELERERRLSRYKSEAVWLGILGAIMYVVN